VTQPASDHLQRSANASAGGLYRRYETWKGWDKPFTYSRDEAAYFAGETRGLEIKDADVLEIGFGSGSFLAWARRQGARIAGTEINGVLIDAAVAHQVELLPAAFERVASEHAARFDTIVAFDVFEHFTFDEILARLKATETMLKPGGHLALRFPNAQSPFGLAPQFGDPTHKTALSRSAFEQLIQGTRFEIVHYQGSYRIGGGTLLERTARALRSGLQRLLGGVLNLIYAQNIPWDPVVVLVLRKRSSLP
jgi:2-polyprenyl-3-methyl-5-hydroxy-6-metoxy-1,4-benzoquinol methylase